MKQLYASLLAFTTGVALTAAASAVSAQTVTRPANPEPVATTQQKANEAMQKAIPQSNVGTVVRTGSAASAAASAAVTPGTTTGTKATTRSGSGVTTTGTASSTAAGSNDAAVTTTRSGRTGAYNAPRRAPRADRG